VLSTWGSSFSTNHVRDEANGEIGIDCGGPNCIPCGGTVQCSNGIKDGDEEDVDCGGSCIPCSVYCQGQVIYWGLGLNPVTVITTPLPAPGFDSHPSHIASDSGIPDPNNGSLLPAYTATSNFIEASNSHVNSGEVVTFKSAGKIKLKTGFSAKNGSTFKAKYASCERCKKMHVISYNAVGSQLKFKISGADKFDVYVYDRNNHFIDKKWDVNIFDSNPVIWDFTNYNSGVVYYVIVYFRNDCSGEAQNFTVQFNCLNTYNSPVLKSDYTSKQIVNQAKILVYPNPTNDLVTIENQNDENYSVQIFDFSGKLIESIQKCVGSTNVNMSKYVNGIYTFKILGTTLYVQKVIKN
jgi:hypothetical protein